MPTTETTTFDADTTELDVPLRSLEAIQTAIRDAGTIRAVTGAEQAELLSDDSPSSEYETPSNGAPAPLALPTQLGPFHADIRFSGGIPVGGWSQLTLHSNGAWNFTGHLHDSGGIGYNDAVLWGVQSVRTGDVYILRHQGHMAGTFGFGSRNDDWGNSGINPALAQGWNTLVPAWRWNCRAHVNWDFAGALRDLLQVIGAVQAIGRVITLF